MIQDPKLQLLHESDQPLYWGNVTNVSPEAQTMTVFLSHLQKEVSNIPISNQMSISGIGIRFMPIPGETQVIVMSVKGIYHHVGYYFPDLTNITDNRKNDKSSGLLLQRFLEPGEVQLISRGQGEILLSNDGGVLLRSGLSTFLKLSTKTLSLDVLANTSRLDIGKVRVRSGVIKRPNPTDTTRDMLVLDEDSTLQEFTVNVGVSLDENGLPLVQRDNTTHVSLYPTVGTLSIAEKVYDERGTEEQVNSKSLEGLLRFHTGISFNVDEDGTYTILDETNQNYIKWTVGVNSGQNLTTYELKINDTYITVSSNNSYSIRNAHSTINSNENGAVTISGDASITLQSGSASVQPTLLGQNTFDYINTFITTVFNAHIHGTGVGPSTPPTVPAVAPTPALLSIQVKNN